MEAILSWIATYGYVAIFGTLMLGILGAPFPDDMILAFAGYLVSIGRLELGFTFVAAFAGSVCGITLSYGLGRFLGVSVVDKYGPLLHVTQQRLNLFTRWYERFGKWSLLFGYFISGFRHFAALIAGISRLRIPVFMLFAYAGGLVWCVTLFSIGYTLGEKWTKISEYTSYHSLIVAVLVGAFVAGYYLLTRQSKKTCEFAAK